MRLLFLFLLFAFQQVANAQPSQKKLLKEVNLFHQALVKKDLLQLESSTHPDLIYQHSNGWIETKNEQIENIKTSYLVYHQFTERAMKIEQKKREAKVLFQATIDVTLKGERHTYVLNVQEKWVQVGKHWLIINRQATR